MPTPPPRRRYGFGIESLPPEIPGPPAPPGFPRPGLPTEPLVAPPYSFVPADGGLGIELRDRLLEQRRVLVQGVLDDDLATRAAAELMLLDGTGDDAIEIHLSCRDGELSAANALADTIELVGVPVHAVARGRVSGPALAPFVTADHRTASASAMFELRHPVVQASGSSGELQAFATRHRREIDALHRRVAAATGQPVDRVADDFATGVILDADEARRYGIVHEVLRTKAAPVTPLRPST
jgi:ATP-dependent Clp protease protease subunit